MNEMRNDLREPGPQPDPMLSEGRASGARKWAVTGAIVAVLLAVMYGMTARREVSDAQRQTEIQREQSAPVKNQSGEALPGGRGTSSAPPAPTTTKPGG
jgi:hypothetical protein